MTVIGSRSKVRDMITDTDVKKIKTGLKDTFVSKPELKQVVRDEVRDELSLQKPEWIREITESVTKALGEKIDKMYIKLDLFIGEIRTRREEQTLHDGSHQRIDKRLARLEKDTHLPPFAD